jgi:hypothetical protein
MNLDNFFQIFKVTGIFLIDFEVIFSGGRGGE